MKIIFYGGRQAGVTSLLTIAALGHEIVCVIPVDEPVEIVAENIKLNVQKPKNINLNKFVDYLNTLEADLLVCCHGREIIKERLLNKYKAINLHPCLYKYKGADPIGRMLADKNKKASVAAHWITDQVDRGEMIIENFKEIKSDNVIGVYNELYHLYSKSLTEALEKIKDVI